MTLERGDYIVRPAKASDASSIVRIGRAAFHEFYSHAASTPDVLSTYLDANYTASAIISEIEHPTRHYLVITLSDEPIGFLCLRTDTDDESVQDYPNRVEIQRVYVATQYHGKGVGQMLLRAAFEKAKEMGYAYVWLGVWENAMGPRKFYEKAGFKQVGQHIFMLGTDRHLDYTLVKEL